MMFWLPLLGCSTPEVSEAPEPAPAVEPAPAPARERKTGKTGKAGKATCPEGVRTNPGWEGEYPDPIVDVTRPASMMGRRETCQRKATVACTVPAGLYHPWSEEDHDAEYRTVRAVQRYKVLKDTQIGPDQVRAGTVVTVTQYLSEGICLFDVEGTEVEAMCPGVGDDGKTFEELPGPDFDARQLLRVPCDGGEPTWVDAAELMAQPGVREGTLIEFGRVGPGTR